MSSQSFSTIQLIFWCTVVISEMVNSFSSEGLLGGGGGEAEERLRERRP
jgi:hypothetical protein